MEGMRALLCAALLLLIARPVYCDVDFLSVRPSMDTDYRHEQGKPAEKYFYESPFHYHYDGRFASAPLDDAEVIPHLTALVKTYLSTMSNISAETWIMHGTLLGWWWNQKIMPWDSDIDVQTSETTMHFLGSYYNMSEHHFDLPGVEGGRSYLFEVNPHHVIRTTEDKNNIIDARWIDMSSGLFIDITSVRKDYEARNKGHDGALRAKDWHVYYENDIFPLRNSFFEGMPVKVPYQYAKLLTEEYGEKCLTETHFNDYTFNEEKMLWESDKPS